MDHGRSLEESKKLGPQSPTTVIRQHIDFTWLILRRGWKTSLGERTYYHCTAGSCALHSCFIKETWSTGKLRVIMDAGLSKKFWFVQDAKMGPRAMLVLQNRRTCPSTYFSQQRKTFPKEQVRHKRNISSKWSAEDRTKQALCCLSSGAPDSQQASPGECLQDVIETAITSLCQLYIYI